MKQDITEDKLIRYILGEASESEAQEIALWISVSDANARHFEQTKFILETSTRLAQDSPTSELDAWEIFKANREASRNQPKVRSITTYNNWLRIAATILLIAGVSAAYFYYHLGNKAPEYVIVKTLDKVRTDTLPDGSVVHLNKNSSISYTGNFKSHREIKLTGEAFFDVIHNNAAPFTVHIKDIDVRDIGTAFNISSNSGRVEVIVESGLVKVSRRTKSIELKQKEMVSIKPGDQLLKKLKNDDLLYNYYRTNEFIADHTPLQRLVNKLNEAYGVNIRIEGKTLAATPITSTFTNDSLDNILRVIKMTTPEIRIVREGNDIILK